MNRSLSIEEAATLLKKTDPSMPEKFSVTGVAYCPETGAFYVRWFDEKEKEIYDDGVARTDAAGAETAYSFRPSYSYSAVWFNESEDGSGAAKPVAAVLEPGDLEDMRRSGLELRLLDAV